MSGGSSQYLVKSRSSQDDYIYMGDIWILNSHSEASYWSVRKWSWCYCSLNLHLELNKAHYSPGFKNGNFINNSAILSISIITFTIQEWLTPVFLKSLFFISWQTDCRNEIKTYIVFSAAKIWRVYINPHNKYFKT